MPFLSKLTTRARNYKSAIAAAAVVRSLSSSYPNPDPFVIPDDPTSGHYDELVNSVGREGDFDALYRLLNKRIKDGCFNTAQTFRFLDESSLPALDDLVRTFVRLDAGFTQKNAFDSLVSRLCRLGRVDDSLRVVEVMLSAGGCRVNAVTLHPILNQLTRTKDFDRAWRVVEEMRGKGIPPDLTAYNYFLTAHAASGDLSGTVKMLERMEEEGMGADTRTYDAMVLAACRAGKPEGAVAVLRRMVEEGVPPLYSTHIHVIKALLRQHRIAEAVEFVRTFAGKDENLDSENFGIMANELIKKKRFAEAKSILEEMERRDLRLGDQLKSCYDRILMKEKQESGENTN
ncbi:hypothetical protein CDL15_Pgr022514 [Punica granatum]|uniref:Pentatricopeptide repeat-containing protein-mitochondrial domain-containing protein n=1 Tax=Punica granatum TaxID=22663 RepID=A0A218XR23_PUNGR|nr:hypothetical protein CDL15_Pgr022514 [Punica granatum]PKI46687.1 hypothetical protein CRG98_033029 [Punica granatum]